MNINREFLLAQLKILGINVDLEVSKNNEEVLIQLIPHDFEKTNGFKINTKIGWRTVHSRIEFGTYSLPLLIAFQTADEGKKNKCTSFAKSAIKNGFQFIFQINHNQINFDNFKSWPHSWENVNIEIVSKPFDTENQDELHDIISFEQQTLLCSVISLLEIEYLDKHEQSEVFEFELLPEGAKTKVEVNKYERNFLNRAACINYYGLLCQVCGFDFEKKYGSLGKGFIHVHHVIPISTLGEGYLINPITDLVPVCPNCHYMLHKKEPPLSVKELKLLLASE